MQVYTQKEDDIILAGRLRADPLPYADIVQQIRARTGIIRTESSLSSRFSQIRPSNSRLREPGPGLPWVDREVKALHKAVKESADPRNPAWDEIVDALAEKGIDRTAYAVAKKWRTERLQYELSSSESEDSSEEDEDEESSSEEDIPLATLKKRPRKSPREHNPEEKRARAVAPLSPVQDAPPSSNGVSPSSSSSSVTLPETPEERSLVELLNNPPAGFTFASLRAVLEAFDALAQEHEASAMAKATAAISGLSQTYLVPGATLEQLQEFPELSAAEMKRLAGEARAGKQLVVEALIGALRRWASE